LRKHREAVLARRKQPAPKMTKITSTLNTRSANIEGSSPMEGFVREGEGTDAALERHHFGISSMQK
jgi:hypothetical protein